MVSRIELIWWVLMMWPYRLIWMPLVYGDYRWWHLTYHRSVKAYNKAIDAGNQANWDDYVPPERWGEW